MTGFFRKLAVLCALSVSTMAGGAGAQEALPAPEGPVVLTVSGDIARTNDGETAAFDMEMLRDLGTVTIETSTIWTEGPQTFEGVEIGTLLEALGADGATLTASAINDYSVTIPSTDWGPGQAVLAFTRNGEEMSRRDKGPLWIIYPYDSDEAFQTETIYSRSIWQLNRLQVGE